MSKVPTIQEKSYAILVTWDDGEKEYLNKGASISEFKSRVKAQDMVDFMMQGMSDQVQSINVVPFPGDYQ